MCFEACHEIWRPFPPRPEGDFRLGPLLLATAGGAQQDALTPRDLTPVAGVSPWLLRQVVLRREASGVRRLRESHRLSLRCVGNCMLRVVLIFCVTHKLFIVKCSYRLSHVRHVPKCRVLLLLLLPPSLVTSCCLGHSLSRVISVRTLVDSVS